VARRHGTTPAALRAGLYADLGDAVPVRWPEELLDPSRLVLALNVAVAQALVLRSDRVSLVLEGAARAVLRAAWLLGATLVAGPDSGDPTAGVVHLGWRRGDGGRARGIAAVVPILPWARRFELAALCDVGGLRGRFVLTERDPLLPGPEPRAFDSRLEQRFAAEVL